MNIFNKDLTKLVSIIISTNAVSFTDFEASVVILFKDKISKKAWNSLIDF